MRRRVPFVSSGFARTTCAGCSEPHRPLGGGTALPARTVHHMRSPELTRSAPALAVQSALWRDLDGQVLISRRPRAGGGALRQREPHQRGSLLGTLLEAEGLRGTGDRAAGVRNGWDPSRRGVAALGERSPLVVRSLRLSRLARCAAWRWRGDSGEMTWRWRGDESATSSRASRFGTHSETDETTTKPRASPSRPHALRPCVALDSPHGQRCATPHRGS